jgi:peptidoglycan hydrolase CwlO-like protein
MNKTFSQLLISSAVTLCLAQSAVAEQVDQSSIDKLQQLVREQQEKLDQLQHQLERLEQQVAPADHHRPDHRQPVQDWWPPAPGCGPL